MKKFSFTHAFFKILSLCFFISGFTYQVQAQSLLTISNKTECGIKVKKVFCSAPTTYDFCPPNSEITTPSNQDLKAVFLRFVASNVNNLDFISGPCGTNFIITDVNPHPCMSGWVISEQPWQGGTWFSVGVY